MKKKFLIKKVATIFMTAALAITAVAGIAPARTYASDGSYMEEHKELSVKDYKGTATITSAKANVRDGASTSTSVVKTYKKGTKINLTGRVLKKGKNTKWYRVWVKYKDGGEGAGYISNKTFKINKSSGKSKSSSKSEKKDFTVKKLDKTMKATQDVNVRKGPSTSYGKLGALQKGKTVKVTGQVYKNGKKASWVRVKFDKKTGYICTNYLK